MEVMKVYKITREKEALFILTVPLCVNDYEKKYQKKKRRVDMCDCINGRHTL